MNRPVLQFGCQTYSWEMLGPAWRGDPDDLVAAIHAAGYSGIEITDIMIGRYADQPRAFSERLQSAGLDLVAFSIGSETGFSEVDGVQNDLENCRHWVDFAAYFPGAVLSLGSATAMAEGQRASKISVAADIYNKASEIAAASGVAVAVHPSSHMDTLLFDRDDYDRLFERLEAGVGWVPDTGHILRGGQDLGDTLETYLDRIRYVHLKDVDAEGSWAMLGEGVCDIKKTIETVARGAQFNGWIVAEEESQSAVNNPERAISINLKTLKSVANSEMH
ncbi:MAG: sugar phosphate isomerase/epimerase family protein [Marinosulfonomonas sp.]